MSWMPLQSVGYFMVTSSVYVFKFKMDILRIL